MAAVTVRLARGPVLLVLACAAWWLVLVAAAGGWTLVAWLLRRGFG